MQSVTIYLFLFTVLHKEVLLSPRVAESWFEENDKYEHKLDIHEPQMGTKPLVKEEESPWHDKHYLDVDKEDNSEQIYDKPASFFDSLTDTQHEEIDGLSFDQVLEQAVSDPGDLLGVLQKADPSGKLENLLNNVKEKGGHKSERNTDVKLPNKPFDFLGKLERLRNPTKVSFNRHRKKRNAEDMTLLIKPFVEESGKYYREVLRSGCRPVPQRQLLREMVPQNHHNMSQHPKNLEYLPPVIETYRCAKWHCKCPRNQICMPTSITVNPIRAIVFVLSGDSDDRLRKRKVTLAYKETIRIITDYFNDSMNNHTPLDEKLKDTHHRIINHTSCRCRDRLHFGCPKPLSKFERSDTTHFCNKCDYAEAKLMLLQNRNHMHLVGATENKQVDNRLLDRYCNLHLNGTIEFTESEFIKIARGTLLEPECESGVFNYMARKCLPIMGMEH